MSRRSKHLSERRKADRAEMAKRVKEMASEFDVPATIDPDPYPLGPRETWVIIKPTNGPHLSLDFDGASSQPNVFVLSWHMPLDDKRTIAPGFAPSINEIHRRKATHVCHGFTALESILYSAFASIARGDALREPAEEGTA